MRAGLSRFMRWCSAEGIEPHEVDAGVRALPRGRAERQPDPERLGHLPGDRAAVERRRRHRARLAAGPGPVHRPRALRPAARGFSGTFQADAEPLARPARRQGTGRGARSGRCGRPPRGMALRHPPARLSTGGRRPDPASITSLADLVTLEAASILRFYLDRAGGSLAQTQGLAAPSRPLRGIMWRCAGGDGQPAAHGPQGDAAGPGHDGQEPGCIAPVRRPPAAAPAGDTAGPPLRRPARRRSPALRWAVRLQSALAVAILFAHRCGCEISAPSSSAGPAADRHRQRAGWTVSIPGDEVKNGEPIELPLPERVGQLIDLYRQRVLPVLASDAPVLFPGQNGPKAEVSLAARSPASSSASSASGERAPVPASGGFIFLQVIPTVTRRSGGCSAIATSAPPSSSTPAWRPASRRALRGHPAGSARGAPARSLATVPERRGAGDPPPGPSRSVAACRSRTGPPPTARAGRRRPAGDLLLLDDGPGAGLAARTLQRHRDSYGRWLVWLRAQGRLDPASLPGERATPENIRGYIAALQAMNASGTVLVRLQSLAVVLRWLAPERDWAWLQPALARLAAGVTPARDKRAACSPPMPCSPWRAADGRSRADGLGLGARPGHSIATG